MAFIKAPILSLLSMSGDLVCRVISAPIGVISQHTYRYLNHNRSY